MTDTKKTNRQVYLFLTRCAVLFIVWNVLYYGWISTHTDLEMWLTSKTAMVSTKLLQLYGHAATYADMPQGGEDGQSVSLIYLNHEPLLYIADSCNALTLIVLFTSFILAYPGPWKHKLWFIGLGSFAVFLINIVRVQVLIYNYMYYQSWFDFNHKYTFTMAVYLCVFYFWMLWARHFSHATGNVPVTA